MPSRTLLVAILAAAGCATAPVRATPAPQAEVTLEVFEGPLAMHGEWLMVARHGRVWRPLHVGAGWLPYLYGEWVWTADGWFWLTDEPWGWATYHYGRWAYDPALGWVWIPGFVWGPAWVAWRVGDGFVGWAPLYPEPVEWWVESYPLEPPHWIFVPLRSFVGVRIEIVAVPRARVPALVRSSRPAPPPSAARPSPAPRLGGPARQLVEEHAGRPVKAARVVAVPAPADARRRIEPGAVPVYRPTPGAMRPRPAEPPAPARPTPAPAPAPRPSGVGPERGEATPERAPAPAPAAKPRPAPAPTKEPAPARTEEEEGERPAPAKPREGAERIRRDP
jgi:hypothetical protein